MSNNVFSKYYGDVPLLLLIYRDVCSEVVIIVGMGRNLERLFIDEDFTKKLFLIWLSGFFFQNCNSFW